MSCTCSLGPSETCSYRHSLADPSSWPIETQSFWQPPMQDTRFISQFLYPPASGMPQTTTHYFYGYPPMYAYAPHDGAHYAPTQAPDTIYAPPLQHPLNPPPSSYHPNQPTRKPKPKGATLRKKRRPKPSSSLGRQAYYQNTSRGARYPGSVSRRSRGRTANDPDAAVYAQAVQYLQSIGVPTGPGPSSSYINRKPRAWRGGYKPPSTKKTLGSYLSRPFKLGSLLPRSPTFSSSRSVLNRALAHRPHGVFPGIAIDLRLDPQDYLQQCAVVAPSFNLHLPATSPPTNRMHIWHKSLPWYINIEASTSAPASSSSPGAGVPYLTVMDVLSGIYAELARPIASHEYYNTLLTESDREALSLAFQRRCRGDLALITKGILRVDFLGLRRNQVDEDRVWFSGLEELHDGMWEMKTGPRSTGCSKRDTDRMVIE